MLGLCIHKPFSLSFSQFKKTHFCSSSSKLSKAVSFLDSICIQCSMQAEQEITFMEVNMNLLAELEDLGFPRARAVRALHHSGNTNLEAAINWLIDHENDADVDQMPPVAINMDIESPQPSDISEAIKIKEQELRNQFRVKKEAEEKKREREREKQRIQTGKQLFEAKRIAEENERQRLIELRKAEKEEEKRAREKVLRKLEVDKLERKQALGMPLERQVGKPSGPVIQGKKNALLVRSVKKDKRMRECLTTLKHTYKDDNAKLKRAFQTLLIYVGNVARNPEEEKFRKIRLGNPHFQERVGRLKGGTEFLELCGFEKSEEGDFLVFPRHKVDMELLNSAASLLMSAITNPFFGLFQQIRQD